MKNRPGAGPSPDNPSSSPQGGADSNREQIRRTIAQAARLAARERARVEALGPFSKALRWVGLALTAAAATILLYGAFAFPDAPIRATSEGFAGKTGKPHTRVEYERFKSWERLLLGSFGLVFVFAVAIVVEEKVRERARR